MIAADFTYIGRSLFRFSELTCRLEFVMMILTSITTLILVMVLGVLADDYPNAIYIIPNAEVPSLGVPGLTPIGQERAQVCLPDVYTQTEILCQPR